MNIKKNNCFIVVIGLLACLIMSMPAGLLADPLDELKGKLGQLQGSLGQLHGKLGQLSDSLKGLKGKLMGLVGGQVPAQVPATVPVPPPPPAEQVVSPAPTVQPQPQPAASPAPVGLAAEGELQPPEKELLDKIKNFVAATSSDESLLKEIFASDRKEIFIKAFKAHLTSEYGAGQELKGWGPAFSSKFPGPPPAPTTFYGILRAALMPPMKLPTGPMKGATGSEVTDIWYGGVSSLLKKTDDELQNNEEVWNLIMPDTKTKLTTWKKEVTTKITQSFRKLTEVELTKFLFILLGYFQPSDSNKKEWKNELIILTLNLLYEHYLFPIINSQESVLDLANKNRINNFLEEIILEVNFYSERDLILQVLLEKSKSFDKEVLKLEKIKNIISHICDSLDVIGKLVLGKISDEIKRFNKDKELKKDFLNFKALR